MSESGGSSNRKISALVVDDEDLGRAYLSSLVEKDQRFYVAAQSNDGYQALRDYQEFRPDVIFLDLQMPRMSGFEFCKRANLTDSSVVFVTAHTDRALAAYDFQPVDFVTKPIRRDRFEQTLDRLARDVAARNSLKRALLKGSAQEATRRRVLHTTDGDLFYYSHEIQYLESSGNYVKVWIQNRAHLVRGTLQQFCDNPEFPNIVVVHRSFAVNTKHVCKVKSNQSGGAELRLANCSQLIPVSRSRRASVIRLLMPNQKQDG